jgi:very-short-patch-repair endonuclease
MRGSTVRAGNVTKTQRARELRKVENEAEQALWSELRARRLNGHKFVRQMPIGPYFADFACRKACLVVEVDGSQHVGRTQDRFRDETMKTNGWSILRFWHTDVLMERKAMLETIVAVLDGRLKRETVAPDLRFIPADNEGASK